MHVLSPEACRPFSKDRTGLVICEGAAILVLEEWEHARAMRAALADATIAPGDVDYVNAHGTGTRLNDKTEVAALAEVLGAHLAATPVSWTKSMIGHCLNAGGAIVLAACALALRHGILPPAMGFREADPECAVDCVPNAARSAPIRVAMSNSFAFGGLNAVLLLRRAQ